MARPTPVLKRLDLTFTKDDGGPERWQIPAGGAVVDFYAQGATVVTGITTITILPTTGFVDVPVFHPGTIRKNDYVQIGTVASQVVKIEGDFTPDSPGSIRGKFSVSFFSGTPNVEIAAGSRLVLLERRPLLYDDPAGVTAVDTTTHQRACDANGRIVVYLVDYRYDFIVTVGAGDVRQYSDAEGSYEMRT